MKVPFNRPHATGNELAYIAEAIASGHLSGDGQFTKRCHAWLRERTGTAAALLTHSCTAALEMAALLADLSPGDEVILPSYTFVSTANAFALRGAVPVFVDIRRDTLNLDETLVEGAITSRTRAICPVHYAGVGCEMDAIADIAKRHELVVIEDAAQAIASTYKGKALGAIGDIGALSFHETKNVVAGEGGALLLRDGTFVHRAEVLREKGTNRSQFFRGEVDKYTWVDLGSSYLPSEVTAAFLFAQFESIESITEERLKIWRFYWEALADAERRGLVRRPIVPDHCVHSGHMFYVLTRSLEARTAALGALKRHGYLAVFHYVPLHASPAGRRLGRATGPMSITNETSDTLLRLPLWVGLELADAAAIVDILISSLAAV